MAYLLLLDEYPLEERPREEWLLVVVFEVVFERGLDLFEDLDLKPQDREELLDFLLRLEDFLFLCVLLDPCVVPAS